MTKSELGNKVSPGVNKVSPEVNKVSPEVNKVSEVNKVAAEGNKVVLYIPLEVPKLSNNQESVCQITKMTLL